MELCKTRRPMRRQQLSLSILLLLAASLFTLASGGLEHDEAAVRVSSAFFTLARRRERARVLGVFMSDVMLQLDKVQ